MPTVQLELLTYTLINALATGTGRPIGDADIPRDADGNMADAPWAIVYPLEGGRRWGPMSDWEADIRVPYQVTSSGEDRRQAQAMADRVRDVITGKSGGTYVTPIVDPSGMRIIQREAQETAPGLDREGTIFTVPETFYLTVTPNDFIIMITEAGDTLLTESGDTLIFEEV